LALDHPYRGKRSIEQPVYITLDAWIGVCATVFCAVTIGKNSNVAPRAGVIPENLLLEPPPVEFTQFINNLHLRLSEAKVLTALAFRLSDI